MECSFIFHDKVAFTHNFGHLLRKWVGDRKRWGKREGRRRKDRSGTSEYHCLIISSPLLSLIFLFISIIALNSWIGKGQMTKPRCLQRCSGVFGQWQCPRPIPECPFERMPLVPCHSQNRSKQETRNSCIYFQWSSFIIFVHGFPHWNQIYPLGVCPRFTMTKADCSFCP